MNGTRDYGIALQQGPYVRIDDGNFPGNPGLEWLTSQAHDQWTRATPIPQQISTGELIQAYRTGRPMNIYQDISSLHPYPIEQVFPNTMTPRLQNVNVVYMNILTSPSLGGKAGL